MDEIVTSIISIPPDGEELPQAPVTHGPEEAIE